MLRLRRYRVFVVFAIIALGLFYHFKGIGYTQSSIAASVSSLRHSSGQGKPIEKAEDSPPLGNSNDRFNGLGQTQVSPDSKSLATSTSAVAGSTGTAAFDTAEEAFEQLNHGLQNTKLQASSSLLTGAQASDPPGLSDKNIPTTARAIPSSTPTVKPAQYQRPPTKASDTTHHRPQGEIQEKGDGELESSEESALPKIHWSQISEHFPVPTKSLIPLPSGDTIRLPKIQHEFDSIPGAGKIQDQDKLDAIKKSFRFSWAGYRAKAWRQDELSPKSGKYRNPFCGWGATLVDSLDTLWLMDLTDEFEDAVNAVKDIDFTTSSRNDIPLFETVIRYLGGLIGAYDISGGKYEALLKKAIELAEVLMGAFDTPNRMPMTFYMWKPTFATQPHRAKTRVIMAELGSLSLEFTRLAQITQQAKYYDAIARITNEFAIWQNETKVPGLWPLKVDASGCKKPEPSSSDSGMHSYGDEKPSLDLAATKTSNTSSFADTPPASKPKQRTQGTQEVSQTPQNGASEDGSMTPSSLIGDDELAAYNPRGHVERREIASRRGREETAANNTAPKCEAQGLASPPFSTTEEFSLGGLADSTYEYLPKEYILLNGLEPKYRSMYELAAEAAKKHLLYRPMIPDANRSILQVGLLKSAGKHHPEYSSEFQAEGTHLTCFTGGMYALGAKAFGRMEDLDIASKLTDGCIWAYEATRTGIMPETFSAIRCKETERCAWNETLWLEALDPYGFQQKLAKSEYAEQHILNEDETKKSDLVEGVQAFHSDDAHGGSMISENASKVEMGHVRQDLPETPINKLDLERIDQTQTTHTHQDAEGVGQSVSLDDGVQTSVTSGPTLPLGNPVPNEPLRRRQLGEIDSKSKSMDERTALKALSTDDDAIVGKTGTTVLKDVSNEPVQKDRLPNDSKLKPLVDTDGNPAVRIHDTALSKDTQVLEPTKTALKDDGDSKSGLPISNKTVSVSGISSEGAPTRSKSADAHVGNEELPLGMKKIISARYLLRFVCL